MAHHRAYRWVISGAWLLALATLPAPITAQGCTLRFEVLHGLTGIDTGNDAHPAWGDLDADGDFDLVVGDFDGTLRLFENTGSAGSAAFAELEGVANPLAGVSVFRSSAPALADLDGDSDLDLVLGQEQQPFRYFENIGSSSAATFVLRTGAADPFDGLSTGGNTRPIFGDLDGDGDLDGVVGLGSGALAYLRNTGTATAPAFVSVMGASNPFNGYTAGTRTTPTLGDLDGDGDLDVTVGTQPGTFDYLRNDGTALAPAFVEVGGASNPLDGRSYSIPAPALVDLDNDGDLDLSIGQQQGHFAYLVNAGTALAPSFAPALGAEDPIAGVHVGIVYAHPNLADLDGDGDLDAVVFGSAYAAYVKNTGSAGVPAFIERFGAANPAESNAPSLRPSSGRLADLDGDGDFALAGEGDSAPPRYWENVGSPTSPSWIERTGLANPFTGVATQPKDILSPELADLDGDGDLDLVVSRGGILDYYRNTGTATIPAFVQQVGAANPFSGLISDYLSLGDFDGDGDLDGVVGFIDGELRYFMNSGSATAPAFTELTGTASPLVSIHPGGIDSHTRPALADLDGDGDADLVLGERTGGLLFYRSTCVVFRDGFESGDTSRWPATVP